MKCYVCDKRIRKSQAYLGDEGTPLEGKHLCESCYYEDEPCATVLYSKDDSHTLSAKLGMKLKENLK